MTKSVIFIEPSGSKTNVFDSSMRLPLLGNLYLGTILHNNGYKVRVYNEYLLNKRLEPLEINADYVCLSSLTLNANRVKELARGIKIMHPETKIIIGGIHASLLPDEFAELADHVVVGEAEHIIVDIIKGKYSQKIIKGGSVENLDDLPIINFNLLVNSEKMDIIPIMTSRGCPFDCNFCTVTKIFGKKFRKQSPDRIIMEIKNAINYFSTKILFFYDDNFTADRNRINILMDKIIAQKIDIIWTAQVRADISREPELLRKMYKAGCNRFYIGFESINDSVLKSFKKSQTRSDIENAIKIIQDQGINIHGMFMLGEDNDNLKNIEETANFAIDFELDTVQFMILTPFPGTRIYEDIDRENRIMHSNWDYYNGMFVVYYPKNMSPHELQQASIEVYEKYYSVGRNALEILYFSFNTMYDALIMNLDNAQRYDLSNIFMRLGAKSIINRFLDINSSYLEYLSDLK